MFYLISILIITCIFFIITLDIIFIPTFILTLVALMSFFGYVTYVYFEVSEDSALYLLGIFFVLALIYVTIVFKFRLWERFSFKEKLAHGSRSELENLNNKLGLTVTDLRPIGVILINNKKRDAIAVNGFIEKNQEVEVIGLSTAQLQVKPYSKSKG